MKTSLLLLAACLVCRCAGAQPVQAELRTTWNPDVRHVRAGEVVERQALVSYGAALRLPVRRGFTAGVNASYGRSGARDESPYASRITVAQVEVPVLYRLYRRGRVGVAAGASLGVARAVLYEAPGAFETGWQRRSRRTKFGASLIAEAGAALYGGLGLRAGLAYQVLDLDMTYAGPADPAAGTFPGVDYVAPAVFSLSGWHPHLGLTMSL